MDCPFCAIASGRAEAARVLETDTAIVFLDRRPLFVGHCLVVPKEHHVTLPDLPLELVGPYFAVVRAVAGAIPEALDAEGTFVAANNVISQSVPHLHTHVVPRRRKDGLRGFFWPRTKYEGGPEEMRAVADRIAAALPEGFDRSRTD